MESPKFWRDLREQFRELIDPARDLHATESDDGTWIVSGGPSDDVVRRSMQAQFSALATRGALAASYLDSESPIDAWLNRLRNSPHAVTWQLSSLEADGVTYRVVDRIAIHNLTTASAELCVELETEAFAQSRAPSATAVGLGMVGGPKLAGWLRRHMDAAGLTDNRVHVQCNIDRKTVKKLLEAQRVRPRVLHKLARGLSVDVADIPWD